MGRSKRELQSLGDVALESTLAMLKDLLKKRGALTHEQESERSWIERILIERGKKPE